MSRLAFVLILAAALGFRVAALDSYGFSEDEAAKLRAIDDYRRGDFSANAEHPMLMKLSMWGSLTAADAWNRVAPATLTVAPETALRLPNALAGAATVAAIGGLAGLLFGWPVSLIAAAIVALDPNVTAINRIGKEDTFLMLFLMLGMYLYERAKVVGAVRPDRAQAWYSASGVSFGLMFASKYMPHFFAMYAIFNGAAVRDPGRNRPRKRTFYGLLVAAFLLANAAIFLPDTWAYYLAYARGDHTPHRGYVYDGTLYDNSAASLIHGVPMSYYVHMLAVKLPLPVLAACAAGFVPLVRRRGERGFIWIRVFLVLSLLGYSLFGSKFQRYALPALLVLDVLAAVGVATALRWLWRRSWSWPARTAACATVCAVFTGALVAGQVRAAPFFSSYQNALGALRAPPLATFPEEAYDHGVREAVADIAAAAGPRAAIVSDAPMAAAYYVGRSGRQDIEVRSLSQDGLRMRGEQWVMLQVGRVYFETASLVAQVQRGQTPWREYRMRDTAVLHVFRVSP